MKDFKVIMNWLRDQIRKWLSICDGPQSLQFQINQLRSDLGDCRTAILDLKDLRDSLKKPQPARPRIYDFESATQEALSEFKEEKNVISRN